MISIADIHPLHRARGLAIAAAALACMTLGACGGGSNTSPVPVDNDAAPVAGPSGFMDQDAPDKQYGPANATASAGIPAPSLDDAAPQASSSGTDNIPMWTDVQNGVHPQ